MIDVIIPAYNAHETICETLSSIVLQSIKDQLNVYIVNDCSKKDYSKEIKRFSKVLNIKEIKTDKNSGPGVARQLGIDSSNSPYIVFIDADDVFYNYKSIETLYNYITNYNYNIVAGRFIEEVGDMIYNHSNDEIWMHGKMYKRQFLDENNIRFNDTYSNEDAGFNNLCFFCTDVLVLDDFIYVWKCNQKSMTRSSEYNFWGIEGFTYNICWAVKCGEERKANAGKMAKLLYETILEVYYRYVVYRKRESSVDDILKWSKDLKKYYLKYINNLSSYVKETSLVSTFENLYMTLGGSDVVLDNDLSFNKFLDMID
jgi:glycosyltransferase involved in cell wall biosynthesis